MSQVNSSKDIGELYLESFRLFEFITSDKFDGDDEKILEAIILFEETRQRILTESLFSKNEILEDISTNSLKV